MKISHGIWKVQLTENHNELKEFGYHIGQPTSTEIIRDFNAWKNID